MEHFSNGAFLKWSNSQIEHFSNGAILKWSILGSPPYAIFQDPKNREIWHAMCYRVRLRAQVADGQATKLRVTVCNRLRN